MTRILFIFAKLNPNVRYVQGMNEVLGPIFYLINQSSDKIDEAACFFMFNNVISDLLEMHIKDFGNAKENPLYQRIQSITTTLLVSFIIIKAV